MSAAIVLESVGRLLLAVNEPERQPGLALDKFSPPGKQESQKDALAAVCRANGDPDLLGRLAVRREATLKDLGAMSWQAETAGPLTLHLSRANALENAGIALHPLYGFAYLPGSGLKGAARAYAETLWLPVQANQGSAKQFIADIFGSAPSNDNAPGGSAGAVVFHDAWPLTWPRLFVDIAAIHHPDYYQAIDTKVPPPGDWETPTLVSFLAIQAGTGFRFALAPRVAGQSSHPETLALARDWLNGALSMLGVGAKTAAGYGRFKIAVPASELPASRAKAHFDLSLVTPAFLAGAAQAADDCDLRGATLRGQLRWWWRKMHAAHLEPKTLRRLEAAIWGASSEGSAVQITVTAGGNPAPEQFSYNADDNGFLNDNGIKPSNAAVPPEERRKTTQGLFYAAYGAGQERSRGTIKPGRFFRQPGSTWVLHVTARQSAYRSAVKDNPVPIDTMIVLRQALAALFLLTRFGGVGAKGRKGFGSLHDVPIHGVNSIDDCKQAARDLRVACGISSETQKPYTDAPSLELMSDPVIIATKWTNPWFALNRIGEAMQAYAKTGKHQYWKVALGVPRKSDNRNAIGTGNEKWLQPEVTIPQIGRKRIERHAAPIHFHVAKTGGTLAIRLVTFVASHLPDEGTSRQRLDALRDKVGLLLENVANRDGAAAIHPRPRIVVVVADDGKPLVGARVRAELLDRASYFDQNKALIMRDKLVKIRR
jgi:CRISPR-associated protein Cmr6